MMFCMKCSLPVVSLEETTSPNGEGSIRRYFCGDEVEAAVIGTHLLLLGDAGLISGSKSMVLFRVAPQAIVPRIILKYDQQRML